MLKYILRIVYIFTQIFCHDAHSSRQKYFMYFSNLSFLLIIFFFYRYTYDANGNMNTYWNADRQITMKYDGGDRLVGYDSNVPYTIDARGFIVARGPEKLNFNSKAQLTNAVHPGFHDVKYTYDAIGRLTSINNEEQNVTQFMYANPNEPEKVTHIHWPLARTTTSLFYDTNGHLMYIEDTSANKYFVASDHLGSPLIIFDADGKIVKRVVR